MNNKRKQITMKNSTNQFLDDLINIKNLYPKKIKIDKNLSRNILIYYIEDETLKDVRYVKFNIVNPLYLRINKMKGYIKENNGNKYLTLVPTN